MKAASEGDDGALCRCVIEQIWPSNIGIDGCVVDDRRARFQVRKSVLREIEVGVDVRVEGLEPLFSIELISTFRHSNRVEACILGEIRNVFDDILESSIVD